MEHAFNVIMEDVKLPSILSVPDNISHVQMNVQAKRYQYFAELIDSLNSDVRLKLEIKRQLGIYINF